MRDPEQLPAGRNRGQTELSAGGQFRQSPPAPAQYIEAVPYGYGSYGEQAEQSTLLEYWYILRRRKGTLILFAALGALAGVLYTVPQTPVYQARTTLEIQPLNQDFLNMRQVTPVEQSPSLTGLTDIPTQIKIIQSETLLERTIEKLKVKDPSELAMDSGRVSAWRRALRLPAAEPTREEALGLAAGSVRVKGSEDTRIVEILCDSTNPRVAARFANVLADEYIRENLESRWNMAQRTGEWLGKQLEDMRIKLERSEDALQEYARRAGLIYTGGDKASLSEEKLRQLQDELGKAQADRVGKQSRYEMAKTSPPEALPDIVNDPSLREYQSKLTDLKRQLADLGSTFTPAHYKVKRLEAQMATVEAAFLKEREAILGRIRNDYQEAMQREKLLLGDYTSQAGRVTQEAEKSIQYNILKREVETNRQLYEAMLQRVKEASIAAAIRASNVRVVDPAKPPSGPYKPQPSRMGMMGLLAGLMLGAGFVVLRERYDRTIQNPEDASFWVGLSELGVIPCAHSGKSRLYYYGRKKHQALPAGGKGEEKGESDCVELATLKHRSSALAESFRATLTSILFSSQNGNRPRVLVLTSAHAAEGKTTVASNLGVALAEAGQKVLLIDADLRKPRLHEIFGVANKLGLSDLLRDREAAAGEALNGFVRETSVPGLLLLTAGPATAAATNLLYSKQLPELIKAARRDYDMVLVDSPPMLHIADARVVGRLADAVVLIIRSGKTTRDAAQAARQRLNEDGIPVLGTVLNDWSPVAGGSGYYRYYKGYKAGYYSHYNSGEGQERC